VIGAAMAEAGVVGIGRLRLSRRDRAVMVKPRGTGMGLFTLRAADEVRASQFGDADGDLDAEMVAIAGAIIKQRTGKFDASTYRDRYQEALQELIEAKMKGVRIEPKEISTPAPVIDLMAALKRSLAQEPPAAKHPPRSAQRRGRTAPDRRQPGLLLPVSGAEAKRRSPQPNRAAPGGASELDVLLAGRARQRSADTEVWLTKAAGCAARTPHATPKSRCGSRCTRPATSWLDCSSSRPGISTASTTHPRWRLSASGLMRTVSRGGYANGVTMSRFLSAIRR
jgi:hypothetical protein